MLYISRENFFNCSFYARFIFSPNITKMRTGDTGVDIFASSGLFLHQKTSFWSHFLSEDIKVFLQKGSHPLTATHKSASFSHNRYTQTKRVKSFSFKCMQ